MAIRTNSGMLNREAGCFLWCFHSTAGAMLTANRTRVQREKEIDPRLGQLFAACV